MDNQKDETEKSKDESAFENLQALIKATDKENPKPEDLKMLRRALDEDSTLVRLNELSKLAFTRVIESVSKSALMRELIIRQIREKRDSFGYTSATIFERMLIDQVILSYIRLNQTEMLHLAKLDASHSLTIGVYYDKRLNAAQSRFAKACESLAKIRKLLAEAELREQQARNKRSRSSAIANRLLKDLST